MNFLTQSPMIANLCPLLPHVAVWGESHKKKMPIIARLIHRLRFQMQEILWWALLGSLGSHGYLSVSLKPNNVHRQVFERIKRCPQSFKKEVNTMSQPNSKALNSEQPTPSLDKTHKAFAAVCHSYGDLSHYYGFSQHVDGKRIDWMKEAINTLSEELEALRIGGVK